VDAGEPIPNLATESAPSGAGRHALARAALIVSIFAFLPPLGLAAIVMGHVAENRSIANPQNGKSMARAALWIAYIQLLVVLSATFIFWTAFHQMAISFQRDAMVQSFFRSSDREQPLDQGEAAEAEHTARTILIQLIAIEDQYRRDSKNGLYACHINELVEDGLEGTTEAEKRAFYQRIADSAYMFEISDCDRGDENSKEGGYFLTAVPRHPRMPEGSAIYCANESGEMRQVRTGTSLDCLKHGDPLP
jgi:Domain of unknown function (DUF4190)